MTTLPLVLATRVFVGDILIIRQDEPKGEARLLRDGEDVGRLPLSISRLFDFRGEVYMVVTSDDKATGEISDFRLTS